MKVISVHDIAALVKQERKNRGWTQADLATHSGVSRDWVIGLEKAKPTVELGLVLRTLKALRISLDVIISKEDVKLASHADFMHSLYSRLKSPANDEK